MRIYLEDAAESICKMWRNVLRHPQSSVAIVLLLLYCRCSIFAIVFSAILFSLFYCRYSIFAILFSLFHSRYSIFRYSIFAILFSLSYFPQSCVAIIGLFCKRPHIRIPKTSAVRCRRINTAATHDCGCLVCDANWLSFLNQYWEWCVWHSFFLSFYTCVTLFLSFILDVCDASRCV